MTPIKMIDTTFRHAVMQNFSEMMQTGSKKAASLASVFKNAENFE